MSIAHCSCGHEWETRKPLEEIEQLRCSECGTAAADDISVGPVTTEPDQSRESPLLTEVQVEAKRTRLTERIHDLIGRIEQSMSEATNHKAAPEMRDEYEQLTELQPKLEEQKIDVSHQEIVGIETFVDGIADTIEEYTDEIEQVDTIEKAIRELQNKKSDQEAHVEQLQQEIAEFEEQKSQLEQKIDKLEDNFFWYEDEYREGYQDAKHQWQITVPCWHCNGPVAIRPGDFYHHEIINDLQGWIEHAPHCPQQNAQIGS